jgi:hypothetical protein
LPISEPWLPWKGSSGVQIPVFVSCASELNPQQERVRGHILSSLEDLGLSAHTVGRSDYPLHSPLHEVLVLARHCSGGLILGFEQTFSPLVRAKRGSEAESADEDVSFATPWNHLEAGILYGLHLPLLVLREKGVTGGIFDSGAGDGFVHVMPSHDDLVANNRLKQVLQRWQAEVQRHYYGA